MTNGRIQVDTSEKTIKNGTSKDRGGERKIWSPEGRTSMANERWESIRGGRGRENWRCGEERKGEKRGRRWKDDLVGEMERGMAVLESEAFVDDI